MKKRILATLLTLCMVLTLLPVMTPAAKAAAPAEVWVNGENIVNNGSTCGGNATYNKSTNTLTLNGVTINAVYDVPMGPDGSTAPYGLFVDGDLTIHLVGNNFITLNTQYAAIGFVAGNLAFSGSGSLTARADDGFGGSGSFTVPTGVSLSITAAMGYAIMFDSITFGGEPCVGTYSRIVYKDNKLSFPISKLYVNGADMLGSGATPSGVSFDDASSTLTLSSATINTASSVERGTYGIYADSALTVHLIGANTVNPSGASDYGIFALGALTFTGSAGSKLTVTTPGSAIAAGGDITIRSGTDITATSTNDDAIREDNTPNGTSIIIEKGAKVTAETTSSNAFNQALYAKKSITIGGIPYTEKDEDDRIVYDGVTFPFPPKVVSVTPNGTSTPTSGDIAIVFDMPMKTSAGTVALNALPALTGGSWSNGNKTYTIPYSSLEDSTPYTVKIENFQGETGNLLAIDSAHSFTTTTKTIVNDKISLATPDLTYNGQEQDCGNATLTGIPSTGTPHWSYTYAAKTGKLGDHQKPLGAGAYTVKVTYNDDANSGEKAFDFTVKKAAATLTLVTADGKTAYTYGDVIPFKVTANPTAVIIAGSGVSFKIGAYDAGSAFIYDEEDYAITHNYDTAGKTVLPGDYTVTATTSASTNYSDASGTLAQKLTLNAKPLTATATKVYDGTKGFTSANLSLAGTESYQSGGATVTDDVTGTIPSFDTASADVGSYNATPAVTLAGARSAYYAAPAAVTATITAKTVSAPAIIADPATYVHTGEAIIPTNVVVKDGLATIPAAEYTLSYSNNTNAGQAVITVTDVAGGNYNVSGTGSFTITAKTAVAVNMDGIALTDKTYDGAALAYSGAAAGTYGESTPYAGGFTYEWYKGSEKLTEAPKAAGSYTLKAIVADRNYAGEGSKAVTIAPKPLTITAENKEMLIGETEPAYTATNSALASSETISGVTFTVVDKNTAQKGVYAIVPACGIITGGNVNYTITYVNGALTVAVNVTAIDTAIAAANLAKTGITMSEGEPSSVENSTKFVKAAEMKALADAIKTAADAKATVGNARQAADAAAALNTAVADFKKAIKIGTYVPSDDDDIAPSPPAPKPEPPKTDPATGNIEVSVPVKPVTKGDTSSATVSEKAVSDAIAAAEKEAAKTGGSATVTVSVDAPKGTKTVETTLSGKSLSAVADGKTESLKISTPVAELSFDSEALKNIAGMAGTDVKISAAQVDTKALTDTQKSQVGEAPVFDFTITSGGKTISDFGGGTAAVSVPYTPKDGEKPEFVTVWLLDDAGKLVPLEASYKDGRISFETGHFSRYAIGYLPFTDVDGHWAYESIVYVYQNKLFSGVGDNKFAPADNSSRAMLWSALYRMAGSPDKTENPATWYADAQKWVIAENISDGTNPGGNVTREQLATILFRCKKAAAAAADMSSFADTAEISGFAKDGCSWAVASGILNGSGGKLNPQGNAARAEVAAMLQRFAAIGK